MFYPALVDKCVTFSSTDASGCCFFWSKYPLSMISDSVRYFEISFSVGPGHVAKDPYLIAWSRVYLVGQQSIWWLKFSKSFWDVG